MVESMKKFSNNTVRQETVPLTFILLFYSGTVIGLQFIFPRLIAFYPQTIFAVTAILLSAVSLIKGSSTLKLERIQYCIAMCCIMASVGLYYRSAEVGCLTQGRETVSILWKEFIFVSILVISTRTLSALIFAQKWILITVALFVLHSIKAIFAGFSGEGGRFDNYVGLISNADYIGIFTAIFFVIFLHVSMQSRKKINGLLLFALAVFSLIIMLKTQTRAAVIVLGMVTFWWIVIISTSKAELFKKGIVMLSVVVAVVIFGRLFSLSFDTFFDRIATITRSISDEADFNAKSRLFLWKQGLAMGIANPLLGVGPGATAPYLNLNFEGKVLQDRQSKAVGFSLHHTFIQIFAERGIIGLLLFCLILLAAYRNFNEVARYARAQPEKRQLVILADVGRLYFVGFVVGGMFNSIENDWTLFVFIALAICSRQYIHGTGVTSPIGE